VSKAGKRSAHVKITHVFDEQSRTKVGEDAIEDIWALGTPPPDSPLREAIAKVVEDDSQSAGPKRKKQRTKI
jgi:hypothetical protein